MATDAGNLLTYQWSENASAQVWAVAAQAHTNIGSGGAGQSNPRKASASNNNKLCNLQGVCTETNAPAKRQ